MASEFKSVVNGLFRVNKKGEVKRKSENGVYKFAPINKTGSRKKYKITSYTKNGVQKKYYVHHLVAEAFCKKEKYQTQIVFLDGNQDNVNFENLRWVSPKERYEHARKRGDIRTLENSEKKCLRCDNPVLYRDLCSECQQYFTSFKVKLLAGKKTKRRDLPVFQGNIQIS